MTSECEGPYRVASSHASGQQPSNGGFGAASRRPLGASLSTGGPPNQQQLNTQSIEFEINNKTPTLGPDAIAQKLVEINGHMHGGGAQGHPPRPKRSLSPRGGRGASGTQPTAEPGRISQYPAQDTRSGPAGIL